MFTSGVLNPDSEKEIETAATQVEQLIPWLVLDTAMAMAKLNFLEYTLFWAHVSDEGLWEYKGLFTCRS